MANLLTWSKLGPYLYQAYRRGHKYQIEEAGISEGEKRRRYIVRVDNDVVDAAETLKDAKHWAEVAAQNNEE